MSKPYGVRARVRSLAAAVKKQFTAQISRLDQERHSTAASASAGRSRTSQHGADAVNELSIAGGAP